MSEGGVLVWVQHLLGTGHLHRAMAIAEAVGRKGVSVMIAAGGPGIADGLSRGVRLRALPAIRAQDAASFALIDDSGQPVPPSLWRARARALVQWVEELRPEVVVTEMYPFGRGAFHDEIDTMLTCARRVRPTVMAVASVRDILVSKDEARRARMVERFNANFDRLLVHGDARLVPFRATFAPVDALRVKPEHTGYVVRPVAPTSGPRAGVVVSAGGGAVGARLIDAALAARPLCSAAGEPWTIVAGRRADPAQVGAWRKMAVGDVTVLGSVDDLPERIGAAKLAISQAGYNTVAETLMVGTPAVLVPFETAREDEQSVRARHVERLGRAQFLHERILEPATLAAAIDRALTLPYGTPELAFDGAERSADILAAMATGSDDE
ncbi:MAG: hypothetical protein KDE35_09810 [Geminicoccaceae bacterium]|nr:hypothetical protein [Geminicoccaceae bacterium]